MSDAFAFETIWQIRKIVEDTPGRAMLAEIPAAVQAIKDERNALLDQWNSIVQASGSRTHGGAVGVVADIRRERDRLIAEREAVCTWTEDANGIWHTDCGEAFEIQTGSPGQNGLRFCCFCGRKLAEGST